MDRSFYLDLAASSLSMPIGTDLMLHEEADPKATRTNGLALGRVIERAARQWQTPLAVPLMDLMLEKFDLLAQIGVAAKDAEKFHFSGPLEERELTALCGESHAPSCPGSKARDEALEYIRATTDLLPVGMAIGPFSLATRLLADPITAAAMAGSGVGPEDSSEVKLLWQCLQVSEAAVRRSLESQIQHGARAIMICEPAASTAFLSPRQIRAGATHFEQLVMEPNLRLKAFLDAAGCDLVFHDCGDLVDSMVEEFARRLHPVILSLGSSRKLWQDAQLVPKDVVLYGNLPSKTFYSDASMPCEEVIRRTEELVGKMKACGHPHILGTECDVLLVEEARESIWSKVEAMMSAMVKN